MQSNIDWLRPHIRSTLNNVGQVFLPQEHDSKPKLAFKVKFPRLEIILDGRLQDLSLNLGNAYLTKHDVIFIPAGRWNYPIWHHPAKTLSILFGQQQLGFSLQHWDGINLIQLGKYHIARRGPRVGAYLLQALTEISLSPETEKTARFIANALISHCEDLLDSQVETGSRSRALFDAIREFIEQHYKQELTRNTVAAAFHITPNYLSHLFQKTGGIGFNEYLNQVRLENAKTLLKRYDLKVKEIAVACGYADSNYFCRLFRKATARSPSDYRRQYHSHLVKG